MIVMAHAQTKTKMFNEGFLYYLITASIGWMFSILQLNIWTEGVFSFKAFIGGMITASGALFFNRVLFPWVKKVRTNRRKKKDDKGSQPRSK